MAAGPPPNREWCGARRCRPGAGWCGDTAEGTVEARNGGGAVPLSRRCGGVGRWAAAEAGIDVAAMPLPRRVGVWGR